MRQALAVLFALSLFYLPLICHAAPRSMASPLFRSRQYDQEQQAQEYDRDQADQQYDQGDQGYQEYVPYSREQLDNLLAPIALYPDPLLAQVLPASTFTDEIDAAARYVRAYGEDGVDDQPWDISVRSVAHYPEVLYMMDEKLDWTTAVGQAYVNQSTDVMESIQRLRALAYDQGNLVSNAEWQIVDNQGYIQIWPASPEYIYVPSYDPGIVYYRRCYYGDRFSFGFAFGTGFRIGIWLNRDTDWREHRIYYTGWRDNEEWERRSRPFVRIDNTRVRNVYINNTVNVTNVTVNRTVVNRVVNVENINRYNGVHRNVNFNNVARNRGTMYGRPQINNRVIDGNIYTGDPRLNQFRGRRQAPSPGRPEENFRPMPQQQARPGGHTQPRPAPMARQFPPEQRRSAQIRSQVQPRPQFQPQARGQQQYRPSPAVESGPHAFGRSETTFNPWAAQQRGAQSRQQMSRPIERPSPPPRQNRPSRPAPSRPHARGGRR
jgi:hypothetical protein